MKRTWSILLIFGLIGQIAWSVENMYFNLFVYNTIAKDTAAVALMVQLSGVAATVTTLIMGALSDKVGNRKLFISIGYIVWGVSVMLFAAIDTETIAKLFSISDAQVAITATITVVIVMDCVMTFFGSTANDAAFNAWVTDNTTAANRGRFESVLSALPLIGMLVVAGGFGIIVDSIGYSNMFIMLGVLIAACGISGIFLIKDSPSLRRGKGNYFKDIFYGFKPSTIKSNKKLYLLFLAVGVYGIASQVFMPYLIIFMQEFLGLDVMQYSVALGVTILLAAALVIVGGKYTDKKSKTILTFIASAIFIVGLCLLYTVAKCAIGLNKWAIVGLVVVTGLVMIYGYIMIIAMLGAMLRDRTPETTAGKMQGIRMIFTVLLPMIFGPMIGEAINKTTGLTYIDAASGAVVSVPSPEIFITAAALMLVIFIPLGIYAMTRGNTVDIATKYKTGETPLDSYPRPQLKRDSFFNLNGVWKFRAGKIDGKILVPYSPECALSGIGKKLAKKDTLYYERTFTLPQGFNKGRVIANFGAVDCIATVDVNGKRAIRHVGGYTPFSCDITDFLTDGENTISVTVRDEEKFGAARGKQKRKPSGIWYTAQSGIWQTVWLESVPNEYVKSLRIKADMHKAAFAVECVGNGGKGEVTVTVDGVTKTAVDGKCEFEFESPRLWSPETPELYRATVRYGEDEVQTYFALRELTIAKEDGKARIHLNGKPYFLNGVLDQGYYSDGLYTPASYEAMRDDVALMKKAGFNTVRKHAKIEPLVWYAMCDEVGLIVWQDIVNGGGKYRFSTTMMLPFFNKTVSDNKYARFGRKDMGNRKLFERELEDTVECLYNVPSLCLWTLFNEGWGQFDGARLTEKLRKLDYRIIDSSSGWHECGGELLSLHTYFKPLYMPDDSRPVVISEYGGYGLKVDGHVYAPDKSFGYKNFKNADDMNVALTRLVREQLKPLVDKGLSGAIYTQLSDVEEELNGLVTYDREVVKTDFNFNDALWGNDLPYTQKTIAQEGTTRQEKTTEQEESAQTAKPQQVVQEVAQELTADATENVTTKETADATENVAAKETADTTENVAAKETADTTENATAKETADTTENVAAKETAQAEVAASEEVKESTQSTAAQNKTRKRKGEK